MSPRTGRARPLSREERRSAILDAVLPLVLDHGAAVTTAEMAAAAGIAEGTIFRAFPDKAALLHAAIERSLDPEPIESALAEIDVDASLREQLTETAQVLSARYEETTALIAMVRNLPHEEKPRAGAHRVAHEAMARVATAVTELMNRHRNHIRVEPSQAAMLLRGLVFSNVHHLLNPDEQMSPSELVDVLLDGITTTESR